MGAYPGHYHAIIPVTIVGWDAQRLRMQVSVGLEGELRPDPQETALERRYALRQVKARLHQTVFRAAVIAAYGGRCALSSLPEASLLDAAHIAADRDELLGHPVITNGLPLTKLHHAAFDNHLIGISPDEPSTDQRAPNRIHAAEGRMIATALPTRSRVREPPPSRKFRCGQRSGLGAVEWKRSILGPSSMHSVE
jgi:hypothetical protein